MKRALLCIVAVFALLGGTALAQGTNAPQMYAGGSLGVVYLAGFAGVPITAHFGVEGVGLPELDVRAGISFFVTGTGIQIDVDALYNFPIESNLSAYAGAGPRILFGGGDSAFGIGALGGAEYLVAPDIGVFGEVGVTTYLAGPFGILVPGAKVGVNFHF